MQIELPYNFSFSERPYQKEIINDPNPNKVLVLHRRAGKTSLAINKLIIEAIINPSKIFYYVCPTQRQAKDIVWKAPNMLDRFLPPQAVDKKNEVELTIYLKNKSQIQIKGADNPDSLRGTDPFGIVLDEYAQMKPEVYEEIFRPVLAFNGGWSWFIGTPKGKNHFYTQYLKAQNNKNWQSVLLKASKSGILSPEELEVIRQESIEKTFLQEFECEFLDGEGVVFRRVRFNATAKPQEPVNGKQYIMGVDLAKVVDWTVIAVVDRHTHELVHFERFNQIDWQLQKARIEAVARRYNNCPIRIDSTGVGDPIAEDLKRTGLSVYDYKFTNQSKKLLIENLVIMLEQDKIKILDIPEIIQELENFSYEMSSQGNIRYGAPEGQHDDCVIGLALAYFDIGEKIYWNGMASMGLNFKIEYDQFGRPIFK